MARVADNLTAAEVKLMDLMIEKEYTPQECADYLLIEPRTVYFHLSNIRLKYGVCSITLAVIKYLKEVPYQ